MHPLAGMAEPTQTVPPPERQALIRFTQATLAMAAILIGTVMGSAVNDGVAIGGGREGLDLAIEELPRLHA